MKYRCNNPNLRDVNMTTQNITYKKCPKYINGYCTEKSFLACNRMVAEDTPIIYDDFCGDYFIDDGRLPEKMQKDS